MKRRHMWLGSLSVMLAGAAAAIGLGATGGAETPTPDVITPDPRYAAAAALPADLPPASEILGVLRRPATAKDELPAVVVSGYAGLDPSTVRLAFERDGRRLYIGASKAAPGLFCMHFVGAGPETGGNCGIAQGLVGGVHVVRYSKGDGRWNVYGVAADGFTEARVGVKVSEIRGNGFFIEGTVDREQIELTGPAGRLASRLGA